MMDEKLNRLRNELGDAVEVIASLGLSCETMLSIVYDDWAGQQHSGVHFDVETARWIAALGASIDISVYTAGPPMAEDH